MTRFTKADLERGDIVRDQYGREAVLTRFEGPDVDPGETDHHVPRIGPGDVGYVPASSDRPERAVEHGHIGGLTAVRNIEEVLGNVFEDDVEGMHR